MLKTSWKDHVQLFLGLHYQKKGQIYFDPKARWDKTALKVSKVSNRQYNWPNSRKQLPTQNHRINQNLKVVHGLSMKFWAFINSVQDRSWFTHVPYHFRMEFSVSDHCTTSRRGAVRCCRTPRPTRSAQIFSLAWLRTPRFSGKKVHLF